MKMTTRRSLIDRISILFVGMLVAVSALTLSGCGVFSSTKRQTNTVYKGVEGSAGAYRKIMVALPIENSAPWVAVDLNDTFARELEKEIGGNSVYVVRPGSQDFPDRFNDPVRGEENELDTAALAEAGRATGVNLVLSARLVDMRHVTEDQGMLWFAEVAHLARIQMEFSIYHTGTGARLDDRTFFQVIDITEAEGKLIDDGKMPEGLPLGEAFSQIAEKFGKTADAVLKHIPWEGYITRVEGDRIVLSAGELCGLKKGKALTVFKVKKVVVDNGQEFFSPGEALGLVTVSGVYPDRSEAVLEDGGPVLAGYLVREK